MNKNIVFLHSILALLQARLPSSIIFIHRHRIKEFQSILGGTYYEKEITFSHVDLYSIFLRILSYHFWAGTRYTR